MSGDMIFHGSSRKAVIALRLITVYAGRVSHLLMVDCQMAACKWSRS